MNSATDNCQQRLTARCQREHFLSVVDQRPELDEQLSHIVEELTKFEQRIRNKFDELLTQLRDAITQAVTDLRAYREQLEEVFTPVLQPTVTTKQLRNLAQCLDADLIKFSRQTNPRLILAFNRVHPRHKFWLGIFDDLLNFHRTTVKNMPVSLQLRFAEKQAALHAGNSLLDSECPAMIALKCEQPGNTFWKFFLIRYQLKRRYRHIAIPLREMAYEWLIEHNSVDVNSLNKRHEATHKELEQQLQDAARSVRFNLETAASEVTEIAELTTVNEAELQKLSELHGLVATSLERATISIESLQTIYASVFEGMMASIVEEHRKDMATIRRAIEEAGDLHGRWRWNRRLLRKSTKRTWLRVGKYLEMRLQVVTKHLQTRIRRVKGLALHIQDMLGLAEVAEAVRLKVADMPTIQELRKHTGKLPPLYRRLFAMDPLISDEFMVGLEQARKTMQVALTRWQEGYAANVAIIGPEGSGKTSLLNCFEAELDPTIPIWRIELDKRMRSSDDVIEMMVELFPVTTVPTSLPALVQELLALPRGIVRFEHGHMIYLRAVGARQAAEAFFHIMMRTREHLLWLVTYRQFPWKRLQYLFAADDYYTHMVNTQFQDKSHLREAIERRQRASSINAIFSSEGLKARKFEKLRLIHPLESPLMQAALADEYFSTLYRVTGGNMVAALFFWLQSIDLDDKGRMLVQPCWQLDERFITELTSYQLLTLAETMGHGGLSPGEHAEIFRSTAEQSRLVLDYLRETRLLEGRDIDDLGQIRYYVLNPVFHFPVAQVLKNLNILH